MSQRTLHHYKYAVRTTSSRRPGNALPTTPFRLLDLPFSIRRRIYIFAGLFSGFRIHLNYEPPDDEDYCEIHEPFCSQFMSSPNLADIPSQDAISEWSEQVSHFIEGPFPCPKIMLDRDICIPDSESSKARQQDPCFERSATEGLPFQLLYVSNRVALDAKTIFWSENYFSIARSDIGGLSFLEKLSPFSLRLITSLSIRLNYWGNKLIWQDGQRCGPEVMECHPGCPPYGLQDAIGLHPNKIAKNLTEEWERICNRLAKLIPPGVLRLWVFCDVTDIDNAKVLLSPLLQLPLLRDCGIRLRYDPQEENLRIFSEEMTLRLTTPKPVDESKFTFLELPFELQMKILEYTNLISPRDLVLHSDNGGNHMRPTQFMDSNYYQECCGLCRNEEEICYCSSIHAAYSTTCICWQFPASLFLVSHAFRSRVLEVFYSNNKFHIFESFSARVPTTLGLKMFLHRIPVEARRYLRYIHWVTFESVMSARYGDWIQVVDFCADQVDISKLTFIIDVSSGDIANHTYGYENDMYRDPGDETRTHELQKAEWESALKMAKWMKRYKGWKDVFFHLGYQGKDQFPGNRKRMEAILEKTVNGREYDALARGKVYRECSCRIRWDDDMTKILVDHWEDVYKDDPDYLLITSPLVLSQNSR